MIQPAEVPLRCGPDGRRESVTREWATPKCEQCRAIAGGMQKLLGSHTNLSALVAKQGRRALSGILAI